MASASTAAVSSLPSLTELGLLSQQHIRGDLWSFYLTDLGPGLRASADYADHSRHDSAQARKRRRGLKAGKAKASFASGPLPHPVSGHDSDEGDEPEKSTTLESVSENVQRPAGEQSQKMTQTLKRQRESDAEEPERDEQNARNTDHTDHTSNNTCEKSTSDAVDDVEDDERALPLRPPPTPRQSLRTLPVPHTMFSSQQKERLDVGEDLTSHDRENRPEVMDDDGPPADWHSLPWTMRRWGHGKRRRECSPMAGYKGKISKSSRMAAQTWHQPRPLPRTTSMIRADALGSDAMRQMPAHYELYVLYKFDRIDELGGRRRGLRR